MATNPHDSNLPDPRPEQVRSRKETGKARRNGTWRQSVKKAAIEVTLAQLEDPNFRFPELKARRVAGELGVKVKCTKEFPAARQRAEIITKMRNEDLTAVVIAAEDDGN